MESKIEENKAIECCMHCTFTSLRSSIFVTIPLHYVMWPYVLLESRFFNNNMQVGDFISTKNVKSLLLRRKSLDLENSMLDGSKNIRFLYL